VFAFNIFTIGLISWWPWRHFKITVKVFDYVDLSSPKCILDSFRKSFLFVITYCYNMCRHRTNDALLTWLRGKMYSVMTVLKCFNNLLYELDNWFTLFPTSNIIYRKYYMPTCGYEFYLRVELEKIKFISTSGHVIFCLLCKHTSNDVFKKLFGRLDERLRTFFEHFPKIAQGLQR